jgi:probable HAF family extracellular repeat protein
MKAFSLKQSIVAALLCATAAPVLGVQTYLITDLGSLGGGSATASAINDSNQVAGTSTLASGGFDAFLYSGGVMHDLGDLGGDSSGLAVNNIGHVAGYVTGTSIYHPFLFRNGTLTDLGIPAGFNTGSASGVNDFDQVAGQLTSGTRRTARSHAFVWQNGGFLDIGTLGGTSAAANGINDAAQIVGWSITAAGASHAFVWQNGVMTDLGTLPGGGSSSATAINENGIITGSSGTTNSSEDAALFENGTVVDLGVPLGFASSSANALNNNGVVVGVAAVGSYRGVQHAFVAANGEITDLNRLIPGNSGSWVLQTATGINDRGIIIGTGTTNKIQHAFLLTPTTAVTVPQAPIDLTESSGNAVVSLSWVPSFGAASYNVKRSTSSSGPFTTVATVTGTSFTDTGVANCTLYSYAISAVNSAGESPNSTAIGADPQSVPPAPSKLTAEPNTQQNLFDGSAIVLAWNNSDVSCSTAIVVERSTDGVNFQDAFSVGPNQGSIVDGFLNSGTKYYYRVRCQSTGGESGPSNIASAVAP